MVQAIFFTIIIKLFINLVLFSVASIQSVKNTFMHIKSLTITLSFVVFLLSCQKDKSSNSEYTVGKNRFTITVDGTEREYYVHVPAGYTNNSATPVVIMCHGGGQTGEQFYNISGWKEVGDSVNILTVFPTALIYCTNEDGVTANMTKWNSFPGGSAICPGVNQKDDVKFIKDMITAIKARFNVDAKRIYMVGFSNGGQFTATCSVEISDILAAAIASGGGGAFPRDTTCNPVRLLPSMLMFGNKDEKMIKGLGLPAGSSVPMGFTELYATYPYLYSAQPKPYINTFRLNTATYTVSGDTNSVVTADYVGLSGNPNNVFKMVELKGMDHEYPNGLNYPLRGAVYHWAWFKQYSLP